MTSNKDALEVFGWGKIGDYYDANLYDAKSYDKGWEDCKKAIRAALASQNPAGTGNKDALEALDKLTDLHTLYDDRETLEFGEIIRAAMTQPTYNSETHVLVSRKELKMMEELLRTIENQFSSLGLIAQKMEE